MLPADVSGLETWTVSDVPLGVLVSSRHPLSGRTTLGWDDLDGQDLLWFDRELASGYHDAMLDAFRTAGWRPRRLRQGPPRRGLFVAELTHNQSLVAIRPHRDLSCGDDLVWLPLPGAPRLRHALVWDPSHQAADRLRVLACEVAPHTDEDTPRGRTAGPLV